MPRACKKCGKCCIRMVINTGPHRIKTQLKNAKSEEERNELKKLIENIIFIEKEEKGRWWITCRKLQLNKKGQFICTDYENRPDMCKKYPYGGKGTIKGCGYKGKKYKHAKQVGVKKND